ncbi:MAG: DUF445 domain-containing protein [Aquisalimonadaceae bacterium]
MTAADRPMPSGSDASQREVLRRHRRIAGACLLVAGLVFLFTYLLDAPGYWLLLVRAGAEAGLIGGIADWFAVTALFRRPLGLPIPHTAILPRNKDRLGEGLGRFVADNFLEPDMVLRRLEDAEPALRLGQWLRERDNAALVAERLLVMAPDVLNAFDDREVRGFYADAFRDQAARVDLVPVAERLLRMVMEGRHHQQLFDRSVILARELLARNRQLIYQRVEERSSWWIPRRFDRRLAQAIVEGVEEWLTDLSDAEHPSRLELDRALYAFTQQVHASEGARQRLDALRDQLLASPEVREMLETAWDDLRGNVLEGLNDPQSRFRHALIGSFQRFGQTLCDDSEARERLDGRFGLLLRELVLPFREQIGRFIADVVRSWDSETLSERLELAVGRDLQFIRINGTVVGALVGVVLFVVTTAVF